MFGKEMFAKEESKNGRFEKEVMVGKVLGKGILRMVMFRGTYLARRFWRNTCVRRDPWKGDSSVKDVRRQGCSARACSGEK